MRIPSPPAVISHKADTPAAYGGFFMLCPDMRKKFSGIERCDSVVVDPHKGLFLPYGTGSLLVREGKRLLEV